MLQPIMFPRVKVSQTKWPNFDAMLSAQAVCQCVLQWIVSRCLFGQGDPNQKTQNKRGEGRTPEMQKAVC